MPSNKDRLYIALYARGGAPTMLGKEDTYHWALLVGPKDEVENGVGMRYHAKERITGPNASAWLFEERETTLSATSMLLVRVMIAKVENKDRFIYIIRNTPIRQGVEGWNCVGWVQEALQSLEADGKALGTGVTEWTKVRNAVMEYCQRKKDEHRFDGQGNYDMTKAPTYDLVERKERIP
ncbi:hypothetical protein P154DRAFT_420169 [Amniculicola lignicola CBS 123094]|uniref:Uncharacterized protein n=1 Tax=Amniculicola lignicola CBS 123094 TaxID=1392246 RepID=A0A6A5X3C0_9PLEO|nr:hypothetical protein P154DRAFT_420169 [Amniculicola lignicola CBS 123094]